MDRSQILPSKIMTDSQNDLKVNEWLRDTLESHQVFTSDSKNTNTDTTFIEQTEPIDDQFSISDVSDSTEHVEKSNKISIYNNNEPTSQGVFDAFNSFIMGSDRNVFFKMAKKMEFFQTVSHLPGDIVECGVFKGCSIILWLKLINLYHPHSIKKVIGFDFFDNNFVETLGNEVDQNAMQSVFSRCPNLQKSDISLEGISDKISNAGFTKNKFELVKGDLSITSKEYIKDRPGFRISLLYLDVDLENPTYDALVNFWDHITPGGIIIFDEYAYHVWSESNAVDRFIKNKGLNLFNIGVQSPTAFIMKPM